VEDNEKQLEFDIEAYLISNEGEWQPETD